MGSACSTVNCSYFSVLPPELNLHILTFLNAKDLASVALVNREWHRLASDEALWKGLCDKRWRARNAARLERESSSLSLASPHSPADDYDECSEDNGRVRPPNPYLTACALSSLRSSSTHPNRYHPLAGEEASQAKLEGRIRVQKAAGRRLAHWRVLSRRHSGWA